MSKRPKKSVVEAPAETPAAPADAAREAVGTRSPDQVAGDVCAVGYNARRIPSANGK